MKHVLTKYAVVVVVLLFISTDARSQGGKAEPNRIQFVAGSSSSVLTGSLSNGQEMEYVFSAAKGQKVTITMANTSLFDYRVFKPDSDVETEFDSSRTLTLELPDTGDYFLFVRKKMVSRPKTARFRLTLTIR